MDACMYVVGLRAQHLQKHAQQSLWGHRGPRVLPVFPAINLYTSEASSVASSQHFICNSSWSKHKKTYQTDVWGNSNLFWGRSMRLINKLWKENLKCKVCLLGRGANRNRERGSFLKGTLHEKGRTIAMSSERRCLDSLSHGIWKHLKLLFHSPFFTANSMWKSDGRV